MPVISVIMPVYNTKEKFLREAVESILNQTFTDFEFIIINDGSDSITEDIILSYKDLRIKYLKNEQNLGIVQSLNKAVKTAKGKYIARMDADDISMPHRLEKQYEFMENHPQCGVCGTYVTAFGNGNELLSPPSEPEILKLTLLFKKNCIAHPTVLIRRKVLEEYSFQYNEEDTYAEDYGLWLRLLGKVKLYNIRESLLNYRVHDSNISKVYRKPQQRMTCHLMLKFQHEYFGLRTENLEEPIYKLLCSQKLTSSELNQVLDYYLNWFRIGELFEKNIYTKNQVLGLCKKAILNTKPDLKFLFVILKPQLITKAALRYLNLL